MSNETKEYIRLKYKGSGQENIEYIPPHADADEDKIRKHQRVAIYARVSTNKLDQTTSIELQQNHYQDMVNERQEWELVGVYKDEGISGTSIRLREGFNRMLEDCRNGKIDLIITKSISRFARNIVDCISIIRELKTLPNPVGVIFESERLYSMDSTTEMVLSMLSAIAQEESHIRSDLVNMSLEQRFSRGIFLVNRLIGYQRNKNGSLTIIPEEAETVKVCFYLYLNGYTQKEITDIFNRYRRKSKYGETIWHSGDVSYMLRNERYCGDILSRKTYTPNYLDHKYVRNRQNRNQYFQKDHHEPIISRSVYENAVKLEYIFALPASICFAILGGSFVIAYIKSTDFLAQKFAEYVVGRVTDNKTNC